MDAHVYYKRKNRDGWNFKSIFHFFLASLPILSRQFITTQNIDSSLVPAGSTSNSIFDYDEPFFRTPIPEHSMRPLSSNISNLKKQCSLETLVSDIYNNDANNFEKTIEYIQRIFQPDYAIKMYHFLYQLLLKQKKINALTNLLKIVIQLQSYIDRFIQANWLQKDIIENLYENTPKKIEEILMLIQNFNSKELITILKLLKWVMEEKNHTHTSSFVVLAMFIKTIRSNPAHIAIFYDLDQLKANLSKNLMTFIWSKNICLTNKAFENYYLSDATWSISSVFFPCSMITHWNYLYLYPENNSYYKNADQREYIAFTKENIWKISVKKPQNAFIFKNMFTGGLLSASYHRHGKATEQYGYAYSNYTEIELTNEIFEWELIPDETGNYFFIKNKAYNSLLGATYLTQYKCYWEYVWSPTLGSCRDKESKTNKVAPVLTYYSLKNARGILWKAINCTDILYKAKITSPKTYCKGL